MALAPDNLGFKRTTARAYDRRMWTVQREKSKNIVHRIGNRERSGWFTTTATGKCNELAFDAVPDRLTFCLKDIVPYCYLDNHIFMGLTACGQFLLSYTVIYDEDEDASNYNFANAYKYKLFFWIYKPHSVLVNFYAVCLFDDHGVDGMKTVSMVQWLTNSRILVVHGASECDNEDSYITYVAVPKLGCRDCNEIRINESDENYRTDTLCTRCNLTIHTKYTRTDSDPELLPHVNFSHPERLVLISNGFIHVLKIRLEAATNPFVPRHFSYMLTPAEVEVPTIVNTVEPSVLMYNQGRARAETDAGSLVAKIIADFAECETKVLEYPPAKSSNESCLEEFHINGCGGPQSVREESNVRSGSWDVQSSMPRRNGILASSRQLTESVENRGVPAAATSSTSRSAEVKVDSYEFSEEAEERCEKISLFRKKRLADKKYEFSEDNSENIIPYNRMRSKLRRTSATNNYTPPAAGIGIPSTSPIEMIPSHVHRASPNYGFRSPCGSPIGNRCLKSPPNLTNKYTFMGRSPTYVTSPQIPTGTGPTSPHHSAGMFSPKHSYHHYRRLNNVPAYVFTSPKRNGEQLQEIFPATQYPPRQVQMPPPLPVAHTVTSPAVDQDSADKPRCWKRVIRRFVEETDAASVITNEEDDDCISPGYHTSLPVEVHGSCYSHMQMISAASSQRLSCSHVEVTQHSFDLEQFTFYVTNHVCDKHSKNYGVFYDWACELVTVCPHSGIATCVLSVHFTATDRLPVVAAGGGGSGTKAIHQINTSAPTFFGIGGQKSANNSKSNNSNNPSGLAHNKYDCVNCSSNADCVFHRRHYQCCSLFTWDILTGDWHVLDYGELTEIVNKGHNANLKLPASQVKATVRDAAAQLRKRTADMLSNGGHLRVLDSCNGKSKESLVDLRNCIRFTRGKLLASSNFNHDHFDYYEEQDDDEEDEDDSLENIELEDDEEEED